jgi:hypothetical protein
MKRKKERNNDIPDVSLYPISDNDIKELSEKLNYKQLLEVRKRINLNYPGILLIDVYESVKYLSTAKNRRRHYRIDGTNENQVIYLVPNTERDTWLNNENALANTDITEYVEKYKIDKLKYNFNVYKLSDDFSIVEHTMNMLKKEMKIYIDTKKEDNDE